MEVTLEQVQELIKTNDEVRTALSAEFVNTEAVTTFLGTEDGKRLIQPQMDKRANDAIQTWKLNNLQKEIDKAVIAANPSDTPEQKRIKELELQFAQSQKDAVMAQQEAYAFSLATQKNLPHELVKPFVSETAEQTLYGINQLETSFLSAVQTEVEKHLGAGGRRTLPANPSTGDSGAQPVKKLSEMTIPERNALYMSNPAEYNRRKAQG